MSDPRSAKTFSELVLARVAETPDAPAYQFPSGGEWKTLTWKQVGDQVRALACGLRSLGLEDEQRVSILAATRIEWILADLAIMCAGGACTTIYPSNTPDECAYIIRDSGSVIVFADDEKQLAKLRQKRAELPSLKWIVLFDGKPDGDDAITLTELAERGRKYDAEDPARYERVARAVKPDALATLVYTSGTTGEPKGVELIQDCWVYEAQAIDELGLLTQSDVQYLWLPLSHVFGKVLEGAQLRIGFQSAVDGRVDKLVENLAVVKPTFVAAVPRIFEKVRNKVLTSVGTGAKKSIFEWAFAVGGEVSRARQAGRSPGAWLSLKRAIADKLVFSKLRDRFGGRLRYFISGSAPLANEVAEFFDAAGLVILEGYGLTESSAASFINRPAKYKLGTVGQPLPGTEVKLADEDKEVLIRSRGIMRGYHGRPDATRESLDPAEKGGWLHTGDIGELDGDGYLKLTDRKKDLIKTSGGKYVAPQQLEGKLKAMSPFVGNVLVHGNNRNFVTALITLDAEAVRGWAKTHGFDGKPIEELAETKELRAEIQSHVDELNRGLASYASLKKFALLARDFTLESGELTASLKMKRKVIEQHYKQLLDGLYTGGEKSPAA